ncbi:zinc-dependent metalloprotease [Chryseobacterium balustinum]|uniref:Por secretion system C-terminal sorting domain-containing protein n=1 Tax=Chryseobacterium balustinum TaxID=246 RepID=A0AAX2IFW8_9FLAO|nr:zinc-dependent metalloprotease [Chryseobacterium balustinum]AZB31683.1 T9SS C-terminal target domain-containing protein [Chryseobacterium balustinum]SKB84709.1 Por secretion system C-terminal sorting domain-containing protein [Chryseobacterium balustinum]SQA86954.1 zinc-dependent metalloproteinase lipoprotein, BF0631 family [Chryseobacterium balustinum]
MKKFSTLLVLMFFINAFSQDFHKECGFDKVMKKLDDKHPGLKRYREEGEQKILGMNQQAFLNKVGATTSKNALYTGQIYEIPVVVHVIESQDPANANLAVTDQEIINWIGRANSMYATTYGGNFYPEATGATGGNVIPFKLVLAKRSPSCMPTTGIIRYNGSTLTDYDQNGVTDTGATDTQIKNQLAPHWPENSYFNIYVVIGFDGQQQLSYGLMGYAAFPSSYDYDYESFMKVATIKNQNDTTLTHELGHAFGLYHTFQGISANSQTTCPVNNNCATDGDRVCDTSPSRSMYGVAVPNNNAIDPCTTQNYDGTQYNIMNYTNSNRKFTAGQRDRAILMMMEYRKNLINSLGGKDPATVIPSPVSVINAQCNPSGIANPANNNFAIGPYRVVFGDINSVTNGYDSDEANPIYYADYANATCIRPAYATEIPSITATPLKITFMNGFGQAEKFRVKAWIDYNNNGTFEDAELVTNYLSNNIGSGQSSVYTVDLTPAASAVQNTYLRVRIGVDAATRNSVNLPEFTSCSALQYGQIEDYAVKILGSLSTSDIKKDNSDTKIVYLKGENKLQLFGNRNLKFGTYQIYDMSGKLIQKGNSDTNEVRINQELIKGSYIINYSDGDKQGSKKFLNN